MSYVDDHPTHFNYTKRVGRRVRAVQSKFPWQTYANTYYDHPPGYNRYYERHSVDFWGGGGFSPETYTGERGKPLPVPLGNEVWNAIYNAERGPLIHWIIWQGWMWWAPATGGPGWTQQGLNGPVGSDPGHYNHIHVTYQRGS
jgi:hypothetical protein